ncbi:hypothetical protein HS041_12365 [Planomonospora sp. ID67723]|uniref:hypothetical protein n=1 Tax=Planomonospora sp. ID67723 TaxID=2738134 RepID=UPI0018C35659|nr:hypothetical protein [Planomonospora sp. ID67723]MBG0828563.1 hypothetical protein [Planomonospora sp. ID67723]
MALQDGWFSDTYIKALSNDIALDLGDTTAGTNKGALFTGSVSSGTIDFDATNPAYGSSPFNANEASGPGYTAGGINMTVTSFAVLATANKVGWKFSTLLWTATTITAEGLLVYVPGLSNRAVLYRWFGQAYPTSDGDFQITFHADGIWREKLRGTA